MEDQYFALLQRTLEADYVQHLPPLLDTTRPADENARKNLSRAFSGFVVSSICDIAPANGAHSVIDDYDDYGIDAVYYRASTETLYLVQAKLKPAAHFEEGEALAFCRGVKKLVRQELDDFNKNVQDRRLDIEAALEACSQIKMVVAQVGTGISQHANDAIIEFLTKEDQEDERLSDTYESFDAKCAIAALHASKAVPKVNATIKLQKCQSITEPRQTYFGLVKVEDLVALHDQNGVALYERNIRTFLGHKTDVNTAIRETLDKRPQAFMYLNNGVTMLADTIEPKNSEGGKKRLVLRGVSVINGAQTIATSAQFKSESAQHDISAAKVMLTVIKANSDGEFGKSVTRARNHQNPVLLANFAALDDEQERLRRELAHAGLHYAYKAEAPDSTHDPNRIRIDEAAQALAMLHSDPRFIVWVKKEPGSLLDTTSAAYKSLFGNGLKGLKVANAVRINRYIQKRAAAEWGHANPQDRLVYKHGSFALAWIFAKQLRVAAETGALIDENKLMTLLSKPFDDLRQTFLEETKKCLRGPLAVFRNQGETIPLVQSVAIRALGLGPDPVIGHKLKQYTSAQPYPKELFDYIVLKAPQIGGLA